MSEVHIKSSGGGGRQVELTIKEPNPTLREAIADELNHLYDTFVHGPSKAQIDGDTITLGGITDAARANLFVSRIFKDKATAIQGAQISNLNEWTQELQGVLGL